MRREAPPSSDGHLQVTGSAVAVQTGPDGRKRLLEYKAGDYFGELSLLTDAPHAASVECTTDCTCVYLGRCGAPVAKPRPAQPEPKLARRVRPLRQVGIGWIPPPEGWLPPLNDPPPLRQADLREVARPCGPYPRAQRGELQLVRGRGAGGLRPAGPRPVGWGGC